MPRKLYGGQRTKIVCTLGPATENPRIIEQLIRSGMNVARLNLSHGSWEEHASYIKSVRDICRRLSRQVAILIDLPGPKYRTGKMKNGSAILKNGSEVVLTTRSVEGDGKTIPINLPSLSQDVKPGNLVLVDDGAMQLRVLNVTGKDVTCRVTVGGVLTPGRGVVVPGMCISSPFVTDSLKMNLDFAIRQRADYVALSFVSCPDDVEQVRNLLEERGSDIPLISKIERGEAVANFDKILEASDGIMVARGDMGVEIPLQNIPLVQKEIILKCNKVGKSVITATQMLESMVNSPRPTRAEVTDVANAILDGTDAIMLSAETSIGKYPVQTVKMMASIAKQTERHLPYELILTERGKWLEHQTDELISYNACYTAYWLKASAIVAFTQSGSTAKRVSKYRPKVPIIAITQNQKIAGRLILCWGVQAFYIPDIKTLTQLFAIGVEKARELRVTRPGDQVVITGGIPVGTAGVTNLLKVEQVT
jgi:pyruvate kinase